MKEYRITSEITKYIAEDNELIVIRDGFGEHYGKKLWMEYGYARIAVSVDSPNAYHTISLEELKDWRVVRL